MYKLYAMFGSCSLAVHVVLNELQQSVEILNINDDTNKASFARDVPLGQVPALIDGDHIITEGAAILQHLCNKHNSALLPQQGTAATHALQWLAFANATMHPAYSRGFFMKKLGEEANNQKITQAIVSNINKLWQHVENQLNQSAYVAGDNLTVADILLSVIANWSSAISNDIIIGAQTKKLFAKITAMPSYQQALQRENVSYKAAA